MFVTLIKKFRSHLYEICSIVNVSVCPYCHITTCNFMTKHYFVWKSKTPHSFLDARDLISQQQANIPNTRLRSFCSCHCSGVTEINVSSVLRTNADHIPSMRKSYTWCFCYHQILGRKYVCQLALALCFARDLLVLAVIPYCVENVGLEEWISKLWIWYKYEAESKPLDSAACRLQRLYRQIFFLFLIQFRTIGSGI